MATDKPRFSVSFSEESFERIKNYKKKNKISTQSKAVAKLVELALDDMEKVGVINNPSSEADERESQLIGMYRSMNEEGKQRLLDYAAEIRDKIQLLFDGHELIKDKLNELAPKSRVEDLEDDVAMLKDVVKLMRIEIAELKKAQ
nr:hypothetical protein [uncultured Oscillibacter sp.]